MAEKPVGTKTQRKEADEMTTEVALLQYVNPNDLTEHPEAHRIPEMTADEWAEFSEGVRTKKMITSPVYALRNGIVFDGRHRLRAAMECGIKLIPVLFYDITEDEALERMRQEAVERRQLTLGQRVMINLEFSELVERLRAEAKERQIKSAEHTNAKLGRTTNETVSEDLHPPSNSGKVAEHIAHLSGTTGRTVYKAQAVIREAPDLAEKVKSGEITINKAESELKKRKQAEAAKDNVVQLPKRTSIKRSRIDEIVQALDDTSDISPIGDDTLSADGLLNNRADREFRLFAANLVYDYDALREGSELSRKTYIDRLKHVVEGALLLISEFDTDSEVSELAGQFANIIRFSKTEEGRKEIQQLLGGE